MSLGNAKDSSVKVCIVGRVKMLPCIEPASSLQPCLMDALGFPSSMGLLSCVFEGDVEMAGWESAS